MKKRVVSLILLAASALTVTLCAVLQAQSQRMADKIIRLHVVANSDTSADQAVKLAVRDAVLREAGRVLNGAEDPKQAVAAQLPALEAAANAELQRQGSEDLARVSFRRELFPTREYDTFSLPAGVYDSLRVTIGQGEGHNWWCVMFPDLCVTKDDKVRINNTARKKMEKLLGKKTIRKITKDKYLGWLFKV